MEVEVEPDKIIGVSKDEGRNLGMTDKKCHVGLNRKVLCTL